MAKGKAAAKPPVKAGKVKKAVPACGEKLRERLEVFVHISAIKSHAVADSKSRDGYKRAGHDVGLAQAKSKGLSGTCTLSKDFAREGYRLAAKYLETKNTCSSMLCSIQQHAAHAGWNPRSADC